MRRFTVLTLVLTAIVAFLVGAIVAGGVTRSTVGAAPHRPSIDFGKLDASRHFTVGCCAIAGDATATAALAALRRAKFRRDTVITVLPCRGTRLYLPALVFLRGAGFASDPTIAEPRRLAQPVCALCRAASRRNPCTRAEPGVLRAAANQGVFRQMFIGPV